MIGKREGYRHRLLLPRRVQARPKANGKNAAQPRPELIDSWGKGNELAGKAYGNNCERISKIK